MVAWLKGWVSWAWTLVTTPAGALSLGFLTLGGFVGGVMFWGAFNTALEFTNTEKFCISCHEMHDNVYQELTRTIHFANRSGVRATCPDCHVPHQWTDKIARKMQASKEVWSKIFGTIDTRREFLDHRLELAEHEWARMKANDSLECRNCHSAVAMDLTRQTQRAAEIHTRYLLPGKATCIDCHKGIAHELPNMEGVDPGWKVPAELRGENSDPDVQTGNTTLANRLSGISRRSPMVSSHSAASEPVTALLPATRVMRLPVRPPRHPLGLAGIGLTP